MRRKLIGLTLFTEETVGTEAKGKHEEPPQKFHVLYVKCFTGVW